MCFTVQLSKFISYLAVSQTALIFYHVVFDLSRTFFNFLFVIFSTYAIYSFDSIPYVVFDVKKFFKTFYHRTEKEGFEPSRRY